LSYPDRLNAATVLLENWIGPGSAGRIALRHATGDWTYQRLHEESSRIARVLVDEFHVSPASRVLLRSANQPMLVACWLAVLKTGAVAVTTMPMLRARELQDIVAKADVDIAISDTALAKDLEQAMTGRPRARIVCFNRGTPDERDLEPRAASMTPQFQAVKTAADAPAIIAFTSGTTGRSKAAVHTHRDLLATADTYGRHVLAIQPDDICLGSPPIAFTFGLGCLVLFPMRVGASTALIEQPTPPNLLEAAAQFHATILITSPTGYRAMLANLDHADVTSLRKCVSAGETLPANTFDAWERATGIRLMDGIGSTEMLHIFIGSPAGECKSGSTGKVVPGYTAKVVDDEGVEVPRGTIGRLVVRGPTGCRYLDDLANQRKYVAKGWNVTGDAYRQDAGGYFWYESRTDDLIVSSGYNVSGAEIENVLLAHSAVAECAVVGVPDEARGHIVKAFVVAARGFTAGDALARELQDFVKAEVAPYKYPRAIEFVRALPRTLTGKLQRHRLREGAGPDGMTPEDSMTTRGMSPVQLHEPAGWPRPKGYANAVSATGRMVFVSGQIGWDPITLAFPSGALAAEVRQALANVVAALDAAGAKPDQITRLTWYITDRDAYRAQQREIGQAYRDVIGRHYPAMSVVVVAGLVEPGARVEIEATAVVGG